MSYFYNTVENQTHLINTPGRAFYTTPWRAATQAEIDVYLLDQARADKVIELKNDLQAFRDVGFVDSGWTFNLSEQSANYVKAKNDATWTGDDRYKFSDNGYVQRDFTDNTGFDSFSQAITKEEDRVMVLYNNYQLQIAACSTVAEVDAITISFTP